MSRRSARTDAALPLGLAALAFLLAFVQRPGWASSDTKIDLHVDPWRFLGDVTSTWTASGSLGHVQGGQYSGYLFPMGPFFAAGHALGLAPWVVHRLWLGALLALAAWGTVRLLDVLLDGRRGVAHAVAGALVLANPYVVVFVTRTSVTLLGYAALPWLLLAVHRGVRTPEGRGWRWPAAFALLVTATGGGVNAAVTAWALVGPLLLLAWEPLMGDVPWRASARFAVRAGAAALVASLWWAAPVLVQALYGIDFLRFTEQPGTIWATTSVSETLRLMGFWLSYLGVGFYGPSRPFFSDGPAMLYPLGTLVSSLAVPALALGAFAWTRRWRYASFFVALTVIGTLIMAAGFPEGTPLRRALTFAYNRVDAAHFLRTTYKAGPLVALGLACLGGVAAGALWRAVAARAGRARPLAAVGLAAAAAALLAGAAWPLATGRAVDRQLEWKRIPTAWRQAGRDLDRGSSGTRAAILPGGLFAFYDWGGTIDSVLPALTRRPVAVRNIVPYADLHAIDLFWSVDAAIGQERLVPRQLPSLLRALSIGTVIANADEDISRSGAPPPADAARTLAAQPGFARPGRTYGPALTARPGPGEIGAPLRLPTLRRYEVADPPGIVRVQPLGPLTVVDGSAGGLVGLAAFDALPIRTPLAYAADLDPARIRAAARDGGEIVISDSNRRRAFVAARLQQNLGATLTADDSVSEDGVVLDPFGDRGSDAQTVAVLRGVRGVRAPLSPGFEQFPEHRPFAALDGSPRTAWLADRHLASDALWLEVRLAGPRDVPYVDVLPYGDRFGAPAELEVGGRRFRVRPDRWSRLRVGLHGVRRVRVRITQVSRLPGEPKLGVGGLRELRIPGVRVGESLRPPVLAQRALAGADLSHAALTYAFERTMGDTPFRRDPVTAPAQERAPRDGGDGESGIDRIVRPPASRRFGLDAWVSVAPRAPDDALDRLAGYRGEARFDASSRFQGLPRYRASSAFDGDPATAWIGDWVGGPAWIAWSSARELTVRRLALAPSPDVTRFPTRVRVVGERGASPPVGVDGSGGVALPRPLRGRRFRVEILDAAFRPGATSQERSRRAVGVASIRVPGLAAAAIPRGGAIRGRCGDVAVRAGARRAALRPAGTVADLDAGTPLRAAGCDPLRLPAATVRVRSLPGLYRIAWLRLRSPAPRPLARLAAPVGRVVDPGAPGRGGWNGARVALRRPAWLVLGQSYDRGWRAWCDGRSLGAPRILDGYANAWRAPAGCRAVRFSFAPDRPVHWAFGVSAVACVLLLGLLLWPRRRRAVARPAGVSGAPPVPHDDLEPAALPLPRALAFGLALGGVLGFVFAIRAGIAIFPLVTFVLWRGTRARTLALLAGGLLLAVPVAYLATYTRDSRGFRFDYAVEHIAGHWLAVGAVVLLLLALARTLAAQRRGRVSTATPPSPAAEPADEAPPPVRA